MPVQQDLEPATLGQEAPQMQAPEAGLPPEQAETDVQDMAMSQDTPDMTAPEIQLKQ
jgi:hypothetical protein